MKMPRLPVTPVVLLLLVAASTGFAWWASVSATPFNAPVTTLIPVSGIVSGQPESVRFSGQAQVSSELVLDPSRFHRPPAVILIFDLSNVSGIGSSSDARYAAGSDGTTVLRQLVRGDTVEVTFPFARGAMSMSSMSSMRTGVASFALSFDVNTGVITSGSATVSAPNFPR
jgi:hypothetical protein